MPKPSKALITEGFFELKQNAGEGLCWVKGCQRSSRDDRCLCHMHEMRRFRSKKKRSADYCTLRDHSRARGLPFDITPDYWRGIVDAFGYYTVKAGLVVSIDRVNPSAGYVEGNIRVVTIALNVYKGHRERYLPEHVQSMLERKRITAQEENKKFLDMDPPESAEEFCFGDDMEDKTQSADDGDPF
jgi:hypothetical protein